MPNQLVRQYSTSASSAALAIPVCSKETVDTLLSIIEDSHLSEYPPSIRYRQKFWKRLVEELEERSDYPIEDKIYETYLSLLQVPASPQLGLAVTPPIPTYTTHYYPLLDLSSSPNGSSSQNTHDNQIWGRLTVLESPALIQNGTTGLRSWHACLMMAEWLLLHADLVRYRRVLELGSGTGLLGILIAQIQLRRGGGGICMTDNNPTVLQRCASNVELPCNDLGKHNDIHVKGLDWTIPKSRLVTEVREAQPDIVFACDVAFDRDLIPSLVQVIQVALGSAEEAWIAGPVRNPDTIHDFIQRAEDLGLVIDEVEWNLPEGGRAFLGGEEGWLSPDRLKLWRLRMRAQST